MANRQNNLFAAEDWKVAYAAYTQVNFQAYDFDTIRGALVDYVRTNFPENFNDYIESSEFIAIIEMLAFLSQSLAFRVDVNTRENFLETAERRDSVFKLARMLGYNPKRNIPASGLLKVTSVRTSEPLVDSLGNDLSGRTIYWDDANNPQSYEQFITVMNAAMSKTNRFTAPIKTGIVGNIPTELYQLNTLLGTPIAFNFSIPVNGAAKTFSVVNPDFADNSHFFERHPNPANLFNMIYMNDGQGLSSKDTGFYCLARQGTLNFVDFNYTTPIENRTQDINVQNIAENDVYLQEIDTNGLVRATWERVPNLTGQTLNFISKSVNSRNLYVIENRATDGIRIRFPDGNFGNVPSGIFRFWHRVSDPTRYTVHPQDARNISISIPYQNAQGRNYSLSLRISLQYSMTNSLPPESLAAIKDRAPQVYYTQNRMVSAQDYNVFPKAVSNDIIKLTAINRTHAGHSRYIDINDPTGTYHNVDTFCSDAYLYTENKNNSENVIINNNTTALDVVTSVLPNRFKEQAINNFVYYGLRNVWTDPNLGGGINNFKFELDELIEWNPLPVNTVSKTGYLTEQFTTGDRNVLLNNLSRTKTLKENSFLKFINPNNIAEYKWTRVLNVDNNGQLTSGLVSSYGPWTFSEEIPAGWILTECIVSLRKIFTSIESAIIREQIELRKTFALGYHLINDEWYVIPNSSITNASKSGSFYLDSEGKGAYSWLVLMEYSPIDAFSYKYNLTVRGQDYVVQSLQDLKFYNVKNIKVLDSTNRSSQDLITFTTVNTKPAESEDYDWIGAIGSWQNSVTGTTHTPRARQVYLPLRTRDDDWTSVSTSWVSNFGLLKPYGELADQVTENLYVQEAVVPLNTFYQLGATSSETNVVIANNTGQITSIPSKITIPFTSDTFGQDIVTVSGANTYITYRQLPSGGTTGSEVIFVGMVGEDAYSYGVTGASRDPANVVGRLKLVSYDSAASTGVLEYVDLQNNDLHYSKDRTGTISKDTLRVNYRSNKGKLDLPVKWQISDVYKETDGYVDPRKVKVAPIDTDSDMVPDDPRQFSNYVGPEDLVLFEYYTDFDGYTYDRPVRGVILDYRYEHDILVDNEHDQISPGSHKEWTTLSTVDWILVKNTAVASKLINKSNAMGIVVYILETGLVYQILPDSTTSGNNSMLKVTADYFVKHGRGLTQNTTDPDPQNGYIRWQHVAPNDVRIDPSISNIVEMVILTSTYYADVLKWQSSMTGDFPLEPTSNELSTEFNELNNYKAASDTLVFRSAKFKLLFGDQADAEQRARFRVVKLSDQISDNELKTKIISTINDYFRVENWEFGESFYFTELSTYIHQKLGSSIGSIVILPKSSSGTLGELFQVKAEPNELFISTATVSDIEIISRLDNQTLRTDR